MTEPLDKQQQEEILSQAEQMASNMAHSFAALVAGTNPGTNEASVFEKYDKLFRENMSKVLAMSPDEYERHRKHQMEQAHKEQLRRDLERLERKLYDTRQEYRRTQDAARKAGIL